MKSVYFGILIALSGLVLAVAATSKADPVPPGTVFDQVIDVRTAEEFQEDNAPVAVNIDVLEKSFKEKISKLDRKKQYAVYCRSGARSAKAKSVMIDLGFKNVFNLGSLAEAKKVLARESNTPN
jgi:rhodanese-related sulfurtransferase